VSESGAVWLVIGVQAAGKSTLTDRLADQFERGVHVWGGQFYRWANRGWVHMGDPDAAEARRLLDLRYRLSSQVADEYCAAGFTSVVQDNIFGVDVVAWLRRVRARPRHLVVLRPAPGVVAEREDARHDATGKVAYRPGGVTIEALDRELDRTPRVGLWLDSSGQTPDETLAEILRRRDDAVVGDSL
jgi:hypothetical protein